jgi:hypothetical protein
MVAKTCYDQVEFSYKHTNMIHFKSECAVFFLHNQVELL